MSEGNRSRMSPLAWLGVALVVAIGLMALLGALSFSTSDGYYGMMGTGYGWWTVLMMGIPAAFLLIIMVVILAELGRPNSPPSPPSNPGAPLEVVDQRYAEGALSREEYLRIRDDLLRNTLQS